MGYEKPIVFYRGKVLDGRCRLLAMGSKRPTIDPSRCGIPHSDVTTYIEWLPDDTDPIAYVVSANTHRRHLNKRILAEQIVAPLEEEAGSNVNQFPTRGDVERGTVSGRPPWRRGRNTISVRAP